MCRARRMLGAHQDSGRARLELVREDRVGAHKDSARAHLELGRDGALKIRPGVGQGRSLYNDSRGHAWSRAGTTELGKEHARRWNAKSRDRRGHASRKNDMPRRA